MWIDLRYAVRMLAKSPGFAAAAILTLALGIGANTAIFTVANAILLKPLPYADPSRLVLISADRRGQMQGFSYLRYTLLRGQARSFSGLAVFASDTFNLTGRGDPEQVSSARVSANFFDVLGVTPALGRSFSMDEDQPEAKPVVLISHSLWLRKFGAARDIVGHSILLDNRDYTLAGVLPAAFAFPPVGANVELWAPQVFEHSLASADRVRLGVGYLDAIARLRPEATTDQAQAEMNVLNDRYQRDNPARPDVDPNQRMAVRELREQMVANLRPALLILMGAVGLILLIACANVASLLLSRALGRTKEMAVRAALGASRARIVRQLFHETVLLALASGIGGIVLSRWATNFSSLAGAGAFSSIPDVRVDGRVLAFSLGISILSALLFGLAPALQLAKTDLNEVLREEGRGSTGSRRRNRARSLLVVSQVALSMVLLVGSGLLIRSFIRLQTVDLGFDPHNVLTMRITLAPTKYSTAQQMIAFYNRALEEIRELPGVAAVSISSALPLEPSRQSPMLLEGQPVVPMGQRPILNIQTISPDYAKLLHVPLMRGREFTEHDDAASPGVAMVNQAAVQRYWPNENPLGKRIWLGQRKQPVEVVGVFGDIRNTALQTDATPEVILPFPQLPWPLLNLSLRTASDPHAVVSAVLRKISAIDKDQPVTNVKTMEELIGSASAQPRLTTVLLGIFSATALILSMVGIYGVIAYAVAQRTEELGIRMALGAGQRDVFRLVMAQGVWLTLAGIVIGLAGAAALTRWMSSVLYKTSTTDAVTFAASGLLFLVVAVLASYVPARRAARIDPREVLG